VLRPQLSLANSADSSRLFVPVSDKRLRLCVHIPGNTV
jgi:hypothetical protein